MGYKVTYRRAFKTYLQYITVWYVLPVSDRIVIVYSWHDGWSSHMPAIDIELFLVQCSTTGLTKAVVCVNCLWDDSYKRTLVANQKE